MATSARRKKASTPRIASSENFETGFLAIKEKEKELHGEQRQIFSAVVLRIQNNNSTIYELRDEHSQLRSALANLIDERRKKSEVLNLDKEIKHLSHDISILKKKIDLIESKKQEAKLQQEELQRILEHYNNLNEVEHPGVTEIQKFKNKLDKAKIKNNETLQLIKIYQSITNQYDNQKSFWNKEILRQQDEIKKKNHDLEELRLIARQSRYSRDNAKINYKNAEEKYNIEKEKREQKLDKKTRELKALTLQQSANPQYASRNQAQPSMVNSRSIYRTKQNKQNREKREEKIRQLNELLAQLKEEFNTNDPSAIETIFNQRKKSKEILEEQIEDINQSVKILERKIELTKTELEELEFAQSKGVGAMRMFSEGQKVQKKIQDKLMKEEKKISNVHKHYNKLVDTLDRYADLLVIVKDDDEEVPLEPKERFEWIKSKAQLLMDLLDPENSHQLILKTNKAALKYYISQREQEMIPMKKEDKKHSNQPKRIIDPLKSRTQKENRGDVVTRVLDRNQVKQLAVRQAATLKPNRH